MRSVETSRRMMEQEREEVIEFSRGEFAPGRRTTFGFSPTVSLTCNFDPFGSTL